MVKCGSGLLLICALSPPRFPLRVCISPELTRTHRILLWLTRMVHASVLPLLLHCHRRSSRLRGEASPWFGYLQSLPTHVSIPLTWDVTDGDEELAASWLQGTMAENEMMLLDWKGKLKSRPAHRLIAEVRVIPGAISSLLWFDAWPGPLTESVSLLVERDAAQPLQFGC